MLAPRAKALELEPASAREVLARWARLLEAPGAERHAANPSLLPELARFYTQEGNTGLNQIREPGRAPL